MGAETWVLTPQVERALSSFQHRAARWLIGRHPRRWVGGGGGGSWEYPLLTAAMEEAGFKDIGVYFTRRQNTVVKYIATRPILDFCERSVWRPGAFAMTW